MPFEYRIIAEATKVLQHYKQIDLYFFKPKLTNVGIKVRFDNERSEKWECDDLQLKFIKNYKEIEQGLTVFEQWKKIHMPIKFPVFSMQYIAKNPEMFNHDQDTPITYAIQQHLSSIDKQISKAILKADIKKQQFESNKDLTQWVSGQIPISNIFVVEKAKYKSRTHEQGQFKVYPLYGTDIKSTIWDTLCYEARSENSLRKIVMQAGKEIKENVSYPKILEKIFFM